MGTEENYLRMIRGQSRGIRAGIARALLWGLSVPYRVGNGFYHSLWNCGWKKPVALSVPVVSIGNITAGGTGKSPMIAYLTELLIQNGHFPGILSRGYKAQDNGVNDEAQELALRFPKTPHYQDSNRVEAAKRLLSDYPQTDILLLDDGTQYRSLKKDLEVILLDATEPFGYNRLLPRGLLREPISALKRGNMILVSRADLVDTSVLNSIRQRAVRAAGEKPWGETAHIPTAILEWNQGKIKRTPFTQMEGAKRSNVFLFCGIGNSEGFFQMARRYGIHPVGEKAFPDHCHYSEEIVQSLVREAQTKGASCLGCTVKDFVKLGKFSFEIPLFAIEIGLDFLSGEESLRSRILGLF